METGISGERSKADASYAYGQSQTKTDGQGQSTPQQSSEQSSPQSLQATLILKHQHKKYLILQRLPQFGAPKRYLLCLICATWSLIAPYKQIQCQGCKTVVPWKDLKTGLEDVNIPLTP
jgi:hypothetical protein